MMRISRSCTVTVGRGFSTMGVDVTRDIFYEDYADVKFLFHDQAAVGSMRKIL